MSGVNSNAPVARSILETIEPLAGEIDGGIADLVRVMREAGFNTVSSCEGHFTASNFKLARPNVVFNALDRATLHSWVRQLSLTRGPERTLPVSIHMFPVWSPERQVVHEDNWALEIDTSDCDSPEDARSRRDITCLHLITVLQVAIRCRPLAADSFVRSRW